MKDFFLKKKVFPDYSAQKYIFYIYLDYHAGGLRQQMGNLASYFDYNIRNLKMKSFSHIK